MKSCVQFMLECQNKKKKLCCEVARNVDQPSTFLNMIRYVVVCNIIPTMYNAKFSAARCIASCMKMYLSYELVP